MQLRFHGFERCKKGAALKRFARAVCKAVPGLARPGEINFILLTDPQIKKINARFLNHHYSTDVISFEYPREARKADPSLPVGDIYISRNFAARQARRGKYETDQEIALYIVHGLLHLVGYDDHKPADRKRMFARQAQLLRRLAPNLAPPDFR